MYNIRVVNESWKFIIIIFILIGGVNIKGAQAADIQSWRQSITSVKSSVIFLGVESKKGEPEFQASAVIIDVGGVLHLLTAKHVLVEFRDGKLTGPLKDDSLIAFFNRTDGTVGRRPIAQMKKYFDVDWIFHSRSDVDLAVLPFGIEIGADDVLAVPDSLFLNSNSLSELIDVFFVSYQPGIISKDRIRPIYRVGTVSLLLPDKTFYIDGPAFPGNSGSPVFVRPQPTGFSESGPPVFPAPNSGKFIGIIGEYLPYRELAISQQTHRPRVEFEENTGLSRVWSIDLIQELVSSAPFQEQLTRIKKTTKSKTP